MKGINKTIIAFAVMTTLVAGCGQTETTKSTNNNKEVATKEVTEKTSQKVETEKALTAKSEIKKIDIKESRPFIIDESLSKQYNEAIKKEGKEYKGIDSIQIKDKSLSLNVFVDKSNFDSVTDKITEAISLAFAFEKLDNRDFTEIKMDIYDDKGTQVYASTVKLENVSNALTNIGDGIDGNQKYKLYESLGILPLIESLFPEEFKVINDLKKKENDVEIHRDKGTTDEIIQNSKLYNIDKISNNSIRKSIKENNLDLKNINLEEKNIKGNLYINTKGNYEEEINKVIKSISTLYTFTDFEKEIQKVELTVFDAEKNKIDTLTVEVKVFEQLLKETQSITDKSKLTEKINSTLKLDNIIKKFNLKK